MPITKRVNLKGMLVLAGVATLTAAIGFATTVQLAARNSQGGGQGPAGPGGGRGAGMMGQGGPGMRGGPGGGPLGVFGRGMRALDLTDAQRQQVRAIMDSHREDLRAVGDRLRTARKSLHDAIAADAFDESAIRAKAADVGAVEADAAVLRARIHAEVFALLTPEQVKKAQELRTEMDNRMKQGRGGRMRQHQAPRPEPLVEDETSLPEAV